MAAPSGRRESDVGEIPQLFSIIHGQVSSVTFITWFISVYDISWHLYVLQINL